MNFKIIGLMSGTSMDGIDAVLMRTDGENHIEVLHKQSIKYDPSFVKDLKKEESIVRLHKQNIASKEIISKSTQEHISLIKKILNNLSLDPKEIDAIGYHGQTLYHNPLMKTSIQIGDGQMMANQTGIKVINNFRANDINHGGQGAPIAPVYHLALAKKFNQYPIAFINCGGIANITLIDQNDYIIGFDTGPGNVLIDQFIRLRTNNLELYDEDGKYGLKGKIIPQIDEQLKKNLFDFISRKPPKSLDAGDIKLPNDVFNFGTEDICNTLAHFTAYSIAKSLYQFTLPKQVILYGGGWYNPVITNYLKSHLLVLNSKIKISFADEVGLDNSYLEAELIAYLAARSIKKLPLTFPSTTGVIKPCLGGDIFDPQNF